MPSREKEFEFSRVNSKDGDVIFNRSGIYDFAGGTRISFYLEPFCTNENKGLDEPSRIRFSFFVEKEDGSSGLVNDFQIKIEGSDGSSRLFDLDEVDPEQLFWIGKLFTQVAAHYGITMEQQRKKNEEKMNQIK